MRRARKVTVRQKTLLGPTKSRIVIPEDCILVEFKSASQKRTRFEVHPYPSDGKLRIDDPPRTILLDGTLSENGGKHVTVDVDRGVQVGYALGEVTRTVMVEEDVEGVATGGLASRMTRQVPRVETLGVVEWKGIDGVATIINEEDLSFKQITAASMAEWLKTIKTMITITGVALCINGVGFILNAVAWYRQSGISIPNPLNP